MYQNLLGYNSLRIYICLSLWQCIVLPAKAQSLHPVTWERRQDEHRVMASGMHYSASNYTCATWLYPIGTKLLVQAPNGLAVRVVVCDRTCRRYSTRVDLSIIAFQKLAGLELGKLKCIVYVVK